MKKDDKKELTDMILQYMNQHRIDQKEMAALLDIQPSTLCAWLNPDGHGITRKNAERIRFVCRDIISIHGNGNSVLSSQNISSEIERFRNGLIGAFIDSDLSADDMKKALQIIKNFNLE